MYRGCVFFRQPSKNISKTYLATLTLLNIKCIFLNHWTTVSKTKQSDTLCMPIAIHYLLGSLLSTPCFLFYGKSSKHYYIAYLCSPQLTRGPEADTGWVRYYCLWGLPAPDYGGWPHHNLPHTAGCSGEYTSSYYHVLLSKHGK